MNLKHTDVRIHFGCVQGLRELAEALLVAVQLPVSTNKEFPAHDCDLLEVLLRNNRFGGGGNEASDVYLSWSEGGGVGKEQLTVFMNMGKLNPSSPPAPLVYGDGP